MASSSFTFVDPDPTHISCLGGRTVLTCKGCAGNAPRGSICTTCKGHGFTIYPCGRCHPAAAADAAAVRASAAAAATAARSSATPSTSSTSADPNAAGGSARLGDSCGRIDTDYNNKTRNP
ncbi:uncharacterized protein N7515_008318 [Penicillium bovifimosum]|uniref:Uncharacterized protein n=1 Tax=Penicillium bovifimosum TaxID=126998 RepID=A0A9W9KXQ5_9EURO|nr:uncharacterized protein N7515_008318 [Penicillium bovifimosum]KAJ5124493.1 hypothetical protein N7515_008318 [Penicillium bovifimosum]